MGRAITSATFAQRPNCPTIIFDTKKFPTPYKYSLPFGKVQIFFLNFATQVGREGGEDLLVVIGLRLSGRFHLIAGSHLTTALI